MKRVLIGLFVLAAIAAGVMHFLEIGPRIPGIAPHTKPSTAVSPTKTTEVSSQPKAVAVIPQAEAPAKVTKYAEAKDHIVRAKLLLGDVVSENPGTADAYYAGRQAAALENIFANDVPVVPVQLADEIYWRVLRVETTDAYTKVTTEIENTSPNQSKCFYIFDQSPLVLVAEKKVYGMKKTAIERPANIQSCYGNDRWMLQPTQAITLDLYFDTLDRGVIHGMLKYVHDQFREKPALFSLVNVHQAPTL